MILDDICRHKRDEVDLRKAVAPLRALQERCVQRPPARDFRCALRKEGISLIAEIKRASPSKGPLMPNLDPVGLAKTYEAAGSRAISVLTDERFFQGSLADLTAVREIVSAPCLRKDFVIDEYQIYEARAADADAILLIARVLSDQQLKDYLELARVLDLAALVETHTADEIERAMAAGVHIIGVNNRNLATFEVDLRTTLELRRLVPGGYVLVSESGIATRDDVRALEDGGVDAILVGEALVTSANVPAKIRELLGRDAG
jgi:indole-3-glycerol phosphate synthase